MIDHFGILAPHYDRVIRYEDAESLISIMDLPTTGLLLDVGGGTGRVAKVLAGRTGSTIVADVSCNMLRQARLKDLQTVCSSSEGLPFMDGMVDRVILIDALHHVADQRKTAEELWRVLRPGGRIVIQEPDIHLWAVKLLAVGEKLLLMRSHFLSAEAMVELFSFEHAEVTLHDHKNSVYIVVNKPT